MEAREFFIGGGFLGAAAGESQYGCENRYLVEQKPVEHNLNANNFTVDELLDFSKHDEVGAEDFFDGATGRSSAVTAVDSCNSSVSGGQFGGNFSCCSFTDAPFITSELCVPYDDMAELEWLSNFVEDSFSSDEVHNLQLILAAKTSATAINAADSSSSATANCKDIANDYSLPAFPSDVSVPGKARSKRSRAAPCDWSSRLLLVSPPKSQSDDTNSLINNAASATTPSKRRESTDTQGRKCLHCASEKTPQWRTGPMGPKTLCNACGVRYKSGRLVPEYRPAASPTFVSTKHSNSHRKVLELRRQKDLHLHHHQQQLLSQAAIFGGDAYLLHHQQTCGPDYTHMI